MDTSTTFSSFPRLELVQRCSLRRPYETKSDRFKIDREDCKEAFTHTHTHRGVCSVLNAERYGSVFKETRYGREFASLFTYSTFYQM